MVRDEIIGGSRPLVEVLREITLVAKSDASVLITGETGTGKELFAKLVHEVSDRSHFPFVAVNCASIPSTLMESELFGHERGAFTGAISSRMGRVEAANHGTLFLDEIGDMTLDTQPKLLRVLQERSIERLGSNSKTKVDFRLISASNQDLVALTNENKFRVDLLYRIRVFPVFIPPLRSRREDIPALVRHFIWKYGTKLHKHIEFIAPQTMEALMDWSWPGNVRELESFIERSVVLTPGDLLRAPVSELGSVQLDHIAKEAGENIKLTCSNRIDEAAGRAIVTELVKFKGNVKHAAESLGVPRTTLNSQMKKLGLGNMSTRRHLLNSAPRGGANAANTQS